jgi:hypothetical protein
MRGGTGIRPLTILLMAALLLTPILLVAHPSRGDEIIDYFVSAEVSVKGVSNGFLLESAADGISNTKTEANNGTLTAMMSLDGDVSLNWDYVHSEPSCIIAGTVHWSYISGFCDSEPDGNTSYVTAMVTAADTADTDLYTLTVPTIPGGAVITAVTVFSWSRVNATYIPPPTLSYRLKCSGGGYTGLLYVALAGPFANRTAVAPTSCSGAGAWVVADLTGLQLEMTVTIGGIETSYVTATYAGVVVTYQTPYWLDISQVINVPTEQVASVEIFLSCSLVGDTEGFTMQINGVTAATNLCIAPNIDTSYLTDQRGDVVIRTYSNPDPTQTIYSIDLLVARVTLTEGGHPSLKPPDPDCTYNGFSQTIECIDKQDYAGMDVQWVRWQLDDGASIRSEPNGRISLGTRDSPLEIRTTPHILYATAVYASGAEKAMSMKFDAENGVRLIMFIGIGAFIFILLVVVYEKRQKRRPS